MGQVFYDLGFLSVVEVVECSASDLIGSYVGHTGPKTRGQLEKALGKVLFIDEAYRLAEGNFATEAINELVDLLTKPTFMDKIVVILAGYDKDINNLISVNPGLFSRFPEQIVFKDMSSEHCLKVLDRALREQDIEVPSLLEPQSHLHIKMTGLLQQLASLPSWGNARDIKTLAKSIIGTVFRAQASTSAALNLSPEEVIRHTEAMLQERKDRCDNTPPNAANQLLPLRPAQLQAPPLSAVSSKTEIAKTMSTDTSSQQMEPLALPTQEEETERDDGVSDETWNQLQLDRQGAEAEAKISADIIQRREEALSRAKADEQGRMDRLQELERARARAKDEEEVQELKRKAEEARLQERAARIASDKAKAELERARLQEVKQKREQQVQVKLRQMGVCCAGFQWIKQASGYRCAGGSHYVSNGQLGL